MGSQANPIRFVRRSDRWFDLISNGPLSIPRSLLDVPGVRYVEPETSHPDPAWKLEIPSTAWMLDAVRSALPASAQALLFQYTAPFVPDWPALYPHQQEALRFVVDRGGGLLAMSLGTGKTRPAAIAAYLLALQAGKKQNELRPVLVCAPKYLAETWRREIRLALGDRVTFQALSGVQPGPMRRLEFTNFIFCHYDIVHAWWSQITQLKPGSVILDEGHTIRNNRTRRGKAAELAASIAPYRLVLTGTPLLNRPGEMLALLEFVSGKFTWGTPSAFRCRYAGAVRDNFGLKDGPPTHTDEFRTRLESVMFRRTTAEINVHLPPVTREVIYVDLPEETKREYDDMFDGYSADDVVEAILHRRGSKKTLTWLGKLRKLASDAKKQTTKEILLALQQENENTVVFSWRRVTSEFFRDLHRPGVACGEKLTELGPEHRPLVNSWLVHGGMTQGSRETSLVDFAKHGGQLSATLDSLSVGVTLDTARVVVLHDLDWVPATMLQAAGRVTGGLRRVGRNTIEKWIVARGTLDEMMIRLIGLKAGLIEEFTSDLAAQELAKLLGYKERQHTLEKVIAWARTI